MKIYNYNNLDAEKIRQLCARENLLSENVINTVAEISKQVLQQGDDALQKLTAKFDGIKFTTFRVAAQEFANSEPQVSDKLKTAITIAKQNIWKFHEQQISCRVGGKIETTTGVQCWQEFRPIETVGLYIPGGSAPLFSTVLMLAIPALIAGCKRIVLCTPPDKEGNIGPEILWTANALGITEIYKVGGAQAIFALAYGTKQIPKVDKIFGPGNQYVTAAKMQVANKIAIDMPAGPSEVLVIADKNSNTTFVAADLLAQAEHGADSQGVLLCDNESKLNAIIKSTEKQTELLPRKTIIQQSLQNSFAVLVPGLVNAIQFSNTYAPEHLILAIENFAEILPQIQNAGSVFCGPYAFEAFGDYASGPNHTLPTGGFARSYSGVSVTDFGKWVTFQTVTKQGLQNLAPTVTIMAEQEQLLAHKNAIKLRLM